MSPQLEQGYTRIADTILEKVAKTKLNGTQFRILMIVWRSTYGWQKKEHELSENFLSKATGIHKQQIKRELKKMIDDEILTVIKEPTFNTARVIAFNKNYINSIEVAKKIPVSENDTSTGSELDTTTGSELDTQKRDTNKHIKKQYTDTDVFNHYLSLGMIKHRTLTGDMKKAMELARKELNCDNEFLITLLNRHKEKVEETKNKDFPVKARPLQEFFGQKKYQSKMLICSDYDDGVYEVKTKQTKQIEPLNDLSDVPEWVYE